MEKAIAIFVIINFTIMGLSHMIQREAWREFFAALHAMGRPGAFANGFLALVMGSLIVSLHNIWSGIPVILTLIGWAYIAKSTVIFLSPELGLRSIGRVQAKSAKQFVFAGVGLVLISALLLGCVLTGVYDAPIV